MKTLPHPRNSPPASHSDTEVDVGPSSIRKGKKLQAEKRRRARINECLNQIKNIVCGAASHNDPNISKMEKAEILESTLQFLQNHQQRAPEFPENTQARFRCGFNNCASLVLDFLNAQDGLSVEVKKRMTDHLRMRMNSMDHSLPGVLTSGGSAPRGFENAAIMNTLFRSQGRFPTAVAPYTHAPGFVQGALISSSTPTPLLDLSTPARMEAPITTLPQPLPSCLPQEVKKSVRAWQGGNSRDLKVVVPHEVDAPHCDDSFHRIAPADTSASSQEGDEHIESSLPLKEESRRQVSPLPLNDTEGVWRPW